MIAAHPNDARAYYERGGSKKTAGKPKAAALDVVHACELGLERACDVARRHKLFALAGKPAPEDR